MDGSSAEIARDIHLGPDGKLVGPDGTDFDLVIGGFFRGEYVVVAMVSKDGATKAFVEISPVPIEAEGKGGCRLFVKPLDVKGQVFAITGSGFRANHKLKIVQSSVDEKIHETSEGRPDGTLKNVILPAVLGRTGGDASFEASDSDCTVAVQYRWGDQMRQEPTATPTPTR